MASISVGECSRYGRVLFAAILDRARRLHRPGRRLRGGGDRGRCLHAPTESLVALVPFASGAALILVGDIVGTVYDSFLQAAPYPSVADAFYFASTPLFVAGLLLIGRGE